MAGITHWGLLDALDRRRSPLPWPQRLLLVGPGGLGDTVLALPALRVIRRASPLTRIAWFGPGAYAPVVAMMGVDEVLPNHGPAALDLRRFDTILSFADVGADHLGGMTSVAAVPRRVGAFATRQRPRWCNHLVHASRLGWPRHEALRYVRLLRPFGIGRPTLDEARSDCTLGPPVAELPADLPVSGHAVCHPFSAGHAREWPLPCWIVLARAMVATGRAVVFTGSAAEATRFEAAWPRAQRPDGVHDAFGRLDLGQLAVLLWRADAVVAGSTGPLHLAAALGAPTLGLFVPRKGLGLERWAPLGAAAVGVQARRRCPDARKCQNDACSCIRELAPQRIAAALRLPGQRGPDLAALSPYLVAAPPQPTDPTCPT